MLHIAVEPEALALTVTIIGPDGNLLGQTRDPSGDGWTRLRVSAVPERSGAHQVTVAASSAKAPAAAGRYRLLLEPLRTATDRDRLRIQAERAQEEARRLAAQADAESRREAFERYAEIREQWRRLEDVWSEAGVLKEIGDLHYRLGAPRAALPPTQEALSLYEQLHDLRGQAEALNNIGVFSYALGDPRGALEFYARSLALFRRAGNRRGEAATLGSIGLAHRTLGEPDRALAAYEEALSLARAVKVRRAEGYVLRNLGTLLLGFGDVERGLETMRQALELGRQSGDGELEANALAIIGRGYRLKGDFAQALSFSSQALERWRALGNRFAEAESLMQLGALYRVMGRRNEAEEALRAALDQNRTLGTRFGEINALLALAKLQEDGADPSRARETLTQALAASRSTGDITAESDALYRMARLRRSEGDLEAARRDVAAAVALQESLRSRVAESESRATFFASAQAVYEFQIDLLMEMSASRPEEDLVQRAFEASERKRARALLDSLVESQAEIVGGTDPELRRQQTRLGDRLRFQTQQQARMLAGRHKEEAAAALAREIDETVRQYEEVQRQLEAANPAYAAFLDGAVATAAEAQGLLDAGTVLLEFSLGETGSHAWAVTRDKVAGVALPPRSQLASAARAAWENLGTAPALRSSPRPSAAPPSMSRATSDLAHMLLGPLARHLEHERLVIVADGILQHVSFAALPEPEGPHSGRPLLASHEVVVVPSASILKALRAAARPSSPPRSVAVLADPIFEPDDPRVPGASGRRERPNRDADLLRAAGDVGLPGGGATFPRLPFSRREADAIVAAAAPGSALRAVDFAASRATALGPALRDYRIVHFATHGLIDNDHPERSGIVLSLIDDTGRPQDGFVRLHDIYNLRLRAGLVVLSACRTALGRELRGEGLMGVVRAFMYAGAPRVIATLWNVDDRATAALMKEFYSGVLLERRTPAAALRQAQLALRRQPRWSDPFYWAGFVLEGEWR